MSAETVWRYRTSAAIAAVAAAAALAGCESKTRVTITEPPRGAMLAAGEDVTVRGRSEAKRVLVNGIETAAGGAFEAVLPEVDGLGFVTAKIAGDPLFDVRSWIQGEYLAPDEVHHGTMAMSVGPDGLAGGDVSVSSMVSDLIEGEELAGYVDNPLAMTITVVIPVNVTVNVTSVVAPIAAVTLASSGGAVTFSATLEDVEVDYTATAVSLSSSGTALYDTMGVTGDVVLSTTTATLENVVVVASDPVITDSGGLPASGVEALATLLADEIPPAIEGAARNAAAAVFESMMASLRPELRADFDHPITQEPSIETVAAAGDGIGLAYGTLVQAVTPSVAGEGQAVLSRPAACGDAHGAGIEVDVGGALVNQLAFAVWDAGNLAGFSFTRGELEGMGMETLDFPYSQLDHVDVTPLLPPFLEWTAEGPVLRVGEIQVDLSVSGVADSTAWTAATVPVTLEIAADGIRISPDATRETVIMEVGFDRMSDLADQGDVMRILETAVPGVVREVFGDLPAITLPVLELTRLDGSPGPVVVPAAESVETLSECWRIGIALSTGG